MQTESRSGVKIEIKRRKGLTVPVRLVEPEKRSRWKIHDGIRLQVHSSPDLTSHFSHLKIHTPKLKII